MHMLEEINFKHPGFEKYQENVVNQRDLTECNPYWVPTFMANTLDLGYHPLLFKHYQNTMLFSLQQPLTTQTTNQ